MLSLQWRLLMVLGFISSLALADIQVGTAINVFSRYGYLSISMRVVPRNETDRSWIFREPTVDIFTNISERQSIKKSSSRGATFEGDFHMEFCDNVKQLLQAYFRDFLVERLEKPWKAFTGSWSKSIIARNLAGGVCGYEKTDKDMNANTRYMIIIMKGDRDDNINGVRREGVSMPFINGDPCYVLIRVARHREIAVINNPTQMSLDEVAIQDVVEKQIEDIEIGDTSSVIDFVRSFGSHYINSYITGNSLYQVFVYEPSRYKQIKEKLKQKGISNISHTELMEYFSPLHAIFIGRILSASGNTSVEHWAATRLQFSYYGLPFKSLLKLHANAKLLYDLDDLLGNEALLRLELKTLAPVFKDLKKRDWFHEVIDNNLKLWEVNM